jgi:hypothetical protein
MMRPWWRLPGRAVLVSLAGMALLAGSAGTAVAQPDPPPPVTNPAPGVTPGAMVLTGTEDPVVDQLLYTATDGTVWICGAGLSGNPAMPWGSGRLIGGPAPLIYSGTVFAFGRGTDNQLWFSSEGALGGWDPLGGRLTSKPGVASLGGASYAVFVRGTDGAVWERVFNGLKWLAWTRLGGQLLAGTAPAAAYLSGVGKLWIAVVGTNHQVYLKLANGVGGFFSVGGQTTVDPALTEASTVTPNTLAIFYRGPDDAAYWNRYSEAEGLATWQSLGGRFTSGLSAATGIVNGAVSTYTIGLGTNSEVFGNVGTWTASNPVTPTFSGWSEATIPDRLGG